MKTIEETIRDISVVRHEDKLEITHGFEHGNYQNAYTTKDYDIINNEIVGQSGFYRIGCLVGFFSSYEMHEIPNKWRDEVEHYRQVIKIVFPDLGIAID